MSHYHYSLFYIYTLINRCTPSVATHKSKIMWLLISRNLKQRRKNLIIKMSSNNLQAIQWENHEIEHVWTLFSVAAVAGKFEQHSVEVARNESILAPVASCKTHVRFGSLVLFANVGDKTYWLRRYIANKHAC